jgi:signal transduction histidine kinase
VILANAFYFVLTRIVIKPLERLEDQLLHLGKGHRLDSKRFKGNPEIAQITETINDMLDHLQFQDALLKVERIHLVERKFEFIQIFHRAVALSKSKLDDKLIKFSVLVDRQIPSILIADDQRLAQVINNLLDNAAQFTDSGGKVSVSTRLLQQEGDHCMVLVNVVDNGCGIDPDKQLMLFPPLAGEPGYDENDETSWREDSGLGLIISKHIVTLMGGRIWVQSEPGEGSTFSFTFKARIAPDTAYHPVSGQSAQDVIDAEQQAARDAEALAQQRARRLAAHQAALQRARMEES